MTDTPAASPETARQPKEGDVYRFTYSQESWDRARNGLGHGDLRWCFDGQLVFEKGRFHDTYWGLTHYGVDGRRFSVAEAQALGTLEFVCNLNEVEKIREGEYPQYADGDAFDLSYQHGCYKHFVKRKGARKDAAKMREVVERMVTAAGDEVERAHRNLDYAKRRRAELLPRIEAGEEPLI